MNKTGSDTGRRDLRPLVLVFFALCILAATAFRTGLLADLGGQHAAGPQKLVWFDGSVATGLYRVDADSEYPAAEKEPRPESSQSRETQALEPPPAKLAPLFFKPIPINQADAELLRTIPGIGPVFARRIIEFREQHGRINAIEELDAVKGVGPAKLKILKAHLVVDGFPAESREK